MMQLALISVAVIAALAVFFVFVVLRKLLYVAEPNEALVFAGGRRQLPGGRSVGYRLIRGGRGVRLPMLETVHRLDLTMFTIEVSVHNAYSRGGIPLSVVGVANVKIAGEAPLIDNAVERFLGKQRPELMRIAKETLEGNLRGVLAQLTPEEVNEDKVRFAQTLIEEAEHDMHRMGLSLETLKIQNVSDEVGYLGSIGRVRGAAVRREAATAEARMNAEAAVRGSATTMAATLKQVDVEVQLAREEAQKRLIDASSAREAMIAEARAEVVAQVAQVRAAIEQQKARALQVRNQLQADVVEPAEAAAQVAQEAARGGASQVVEQARAQAVALRAQVEQMRRAGQSGREILVLQKLLPMAGLVSGVGAKLSADRVVVLPRGDSGSKDLLKGAEQLGAAFGVDVASSLRRLGTGSATPDVVSATAPSASATVPDASRRPSAPPLPRR